MTVDTEKVQAASGEARRVIGERARGGMREARLSLLRETMLEAFERGLYDHVRSVDDAVYVLHVDAMDCVEDLVGWRRERAAQLRRDV